MARKWLDSEIAKLIRLSRRYGDDFKMYEVHFLSRTKSSIKNQYYACCAKGLISPPTSISRDRAQVSETEISISEELSAAATPLATRLSSGKVKRVEKNTNEIANPSDVTVEELSDLVDSEAASATVEMVMELAMRRSEGVGNREVPDDLVPETSAETSENKENIAAQRIKEFIAQHSQQLAVRPTAGRSCKATVVNDICPPEHDCLRVISAFIAMRGLVSHEKMNPAQNDETTQMIAGLLETMGGNQ